VSILIRISAENVYKVNNSKIRQNDIQDQKKVVFVLKLALTLIDCLEDEQLEF
jgi:hypothetical protein